MNARLPFVVLSGCSGGGKSTLLSELARRGFDTVPEPGRAIVREQTAARGTALPGKDDGAFVRLLIKRYIADYDSARPCGGPVFFDRSLIDAVNWYRQTGRPVSGELDAAARARPYHGLVFLVPPWPEIFEQDAERRHRLDAGIAEYEALIRTYPAYGHSVEIVPRLPVAERADFVLTRLNMSDLDARGTP